MKKCSNSLAIREMEIKTMMRYPSHLSEWLLSTSHIITSVAEVVEKKEPSFTALGNLTGTAITENSVAVPQNIKNRVAIGPSNPSSRYVLEQSKDIYLLRYMHTYVH